MKVLVLMGSPRKKDSFAICKQIESEMNQKEEVIFEYLFLKTLNIEDCLGCDQCFKKGDSYCPITDDLGEIRQKLIEADGIIFASPVYAYQVTGSFKKIIDRLAFLFHRPELIGKPAITVVTTAGSGQKSVSKFLKMTACGWGCNLIDQIEVISSMFFEENGKNHFFREKYHSKVQNKIDKTAVDFLETIKGKTLPTPGYYNLYMFHGLKSKTLTSQADYKYWENKGWLNAPYYYGVKLSPLKRLFGYAIDRLIKSLWKKMQKTNVDT